MEIEDRHKKNSFASKIYRNTVTKMYLCTLWAGGHFKTGHANATQMKQSTD